MPLVPEGQEIVVVRCDSCQRVAARIMMMNIGDGPNFCKQCHDACKLADLDYLLWEEESPIRYEQLVDVIDVKARMVVTKSRDILTYQFISFIRPQ